MEIHIFKQQTSISLFTVSLLIVRDKLWLNRHNFLVQAKLCEDYNKKAKLVKANTVYYYSTIVILPYRIKGTQKIWDRNTL